MKLHRILPILLLFPIATSPCLPINTSQKEQLISQQDKKVFKGSFICKGARLNLTLDAYEESIDIPGLSFLGKTHGYLSGLGVYGVWMITSCKIDGKELRIRLSNDTGSDSQTIVFKQINDSTFSYKAIGGNNIKKAQGRKLVKIDESFQFNRVK